MKFLPPDHKPMGWHEQQTKFQEEKAERCSKVLWRYSEEDKAVMAIFEDWEEQVFVTQQKHTAFIKNTIAKHNANVLGLPNGSHTVHHTPHQKKIKLPWQ